MSDQVLAVKPRVNRSKWPTIVGGILAALIAAFAANGSKLPTVIGSEDENPDSGIAIERRLHNLELNDAAQSADIQSIKEDTHHTRDRLDRFLDSQGSR